ncbi:nucleoid-associated protein [Alkalibaculum sp. M08DMB]|uniref:Nucleoid-associated protein n=1 Tax=Alkalibaculum sporogenes TaxID=2655001 RepID=A0A6A7KAQ7_9FIRM|nr:nucleoid-associated protein [Alkalibaculum sporogenes]MPW26452.1 nucleoid-associated protein [Alkalibaculum sporogenes]
MGQDITIKRAILHILDNAGGISVVSDKTIPMDSEINEYLNKHILKCFSDIDVKNTNFEDRENNGFLKIIQSYVQNDNFLETSKIIAKTFIDFMVNGTSVISGDLLIVDFMHDGQNYLGIFKFNYKYSYIHYVESEDGYRNTIIKQPCTLPLETQKLDEFVIVNLETQYLIVKDKKYEINGVKEEYITKYILNSKVVSTDREVVDLVEKTAKTIIQNEYNNDISKLNTFRKTIADTFVMTNEIDLDNLADTTFEDEIGKKAFKQGILDAGIQENKIKISPNAEKRIVKKQKLVTDSGIEINIPSSCLSDNELVEFVNNIDGTISIIIKNIGTINGK